MITRLKSLAPYFLLILITLLVFLRAFSSDFVVWDDDVLVINNPLLKLPFWEAIRTSFAIFYHGDYFPITLMSFWTDRFFFDLAPHPPHIINLVLHIINVIWVFIIFQKLTKNTWTPLFIALVFALHPLQVESVMWVSERKGLLAAFFIFSSLFSFIKYRETEKKRFLVITCFAFLLATLSKATCLLFPAFFLILDKYYYKKSWKIAFKAALIPILTAITLITIRVVAYSQAARPLVDTAFDFERLKNLPFIALNAIGFYVGKFFWPEPLVPIYPNYEYSISVLITSLCVLVGLIIGAIYLYRTRNILFLLGMTWAFLFWLPILRIFPLVSYVSDRYMYFPIVGLTFAFITLIEPWLKKIKKPQLALPILAFLVLTPAGLKSYSQSKIWTENILLWEYTIQYRPDSVVARNNLALEQMFRGQFDKAIENYLLIINYARSDDNKLLAYNNLANIFANSSFPKRDPKMSISLIKQGLSIATRQRDTYEMKVNLGFNYFEIKDYENAQKTLENVLQELKTEPDYRFQWLIPIVEKKLQAIYSANAKH